MVNASSISEMGYWSLASGQRPGTVWGLVLFWNEVWELTWPLFAFLAWDESAAIVGLLLSGDDERKG